MKKENKIILNITFAILILISIVFSFMLFNKTHELDQKVSSLKTDLEKMTKDLDEILNPPEQSTTYDTSEFIEISAKDIESESKDQLIVVMVGRQGCGFCAMYAPLLQEVASENNVKVRYINFLNLIDIYSGNPQDEEQYNIIKQLPAVEEFKGFGEEAVLEGTPTTMFIKNNKIIYAINGYVPKDLIIDAFEKVGLK